MLQYLINMTAIWVLSLAAFDIFFRHESYHGYNRAYLLSTFLLGIVLPGFAWHNSTFEYTFILGRSVEQTSAIRQTISNTASNNTPTVDWQQYLEYIYLAGVIISTILLIIEALKIFNLYKNGNKLKEGKWIIIETHKGHSPFSLGRYIFTGSKGQYSEAEWQIIVAHEQRHGKLLHFIDLLLMQLARIVFWFHPLVYIYNKRLLLLHEYQADASIQTEPVKYGHFLVEQSMLQTTPSLSHSFIRSPIKNRILMLTKRSS
ncbi:MAG TPA: M56 family metallopeptidase, partial [Flavipsychrobacter sp.]|nr:M56 family metallopeptidase [Flavipsychrobacter sp.]